MLKHLVWVGVIGVAFAVAVVAGAEPTPGTAPSISGMPTVGQTLTLSPGTYTGADGAPVTLTEVWQRCDDSGANGCVPTGGTGGTYQLAAADLGKHIRVAETADDGTPPATTAFSNLIGAVEPPPSPPSKTSDPSVTGSAQFGATLSRSAGTWTGTGTITVTDQWQRCETAASGCSDIGSAAATYTIGAGDVGRFVRVRETASNGVPPDGQAVSNSVGPIAGTPTTSGTPSISGAATAGQTLTANPQLSSWGGVPAPPTVKGYQWIRCTPACADIAGATSGTYVLTAADVGTTVKVRVTAGNGYGDTAADSGPVGPVAGLPTTPGVPTISGTSSLGQTLTANPQLPSWGGVPAPPTVKAYQWIRCNPACADIAGASNATFALTAPDVGATIRVRITAGNGYGDAIAESSPTAQVTGPPTTATVPTIDITAPVRGQTLVGSSGLWAAWPSPALVHQWNRCTVSGSGTTCSPGGTFSITPVSAPPSPFTNTSSYVITDGDLGSRLRLTVTASNTVGAAAPVNSVLTQPVQGAPANIASEGPIVSGTLVRGQTLTATSGKWTGYWQGTAPVSFTHQWQRCNAGGGACVNVNNQPPIAVSLPANVATCTSLAPCDATSSYALSDADMGSTIRVIVQASNGGGTSGNVTSAATAIVNGAPQILQANGVPDPNAIPKINGLAQSGLNIGASSGSWSAFPEAITYAHQWVRCSGTEVGSCSAIAGATATVYAVQDADVGQRLRIRITASNGVDPPGVAYSDPTEPVKAKSAGLGGNGVDLLLSSKASSAGGKLTYMLTATNAGNQGASGVVITATPPAGITIVSATAPGGCSGGGPVTCTLGALGPGASASATIVIQATQTGVVSFAASVGAAEADVNPTNNAVSLTTFLVVTGSTPQANNGIRGQTAGDETVTVNPDGSVALNAVKLKARRIGKTWTVATTFTLVSGNAKIQLAVTKNGSVKKLTLLKGSRLGATIASASRTQLALDTAKPATFPIRIVLPAAAVSPAGIYVIHITATSSTGATSKLNLGFKAVNLVSGKATATRSGSTWVASSTFSLRARKTAVQAWVSRGASAKKLTLLKGSRLGTVQAKAGRSTLLFQAPRAGRYPVRVVLPQKGFSLKETYVIRMEAKSATGLWTDYEIRFKGKAPARILTGTRATP